MRRLFACVVLVFAALGAGVANATVLNINGGPGGSAYAPAGTYATATSLVNPVPLSLPAGSYTLTMTTPTITAGALYSGFRFDAGAADWCEDLDVYTATTGSPLVPFLLVESQSYGTSGPDAFTKPVRYNYSGVWSGYQSASTPINFTLAAPTTLYFVADDYNLSDNAGGLSVVVAPEPGGLALLAATGMLPALRRRRR